MRENLTQRVPLKEFFEIDGSSSNLNQVQRDYVQKLSEANPQLCLLGIGENGHLAFNDPAEADFSDPVAMKIVTLDAECRQQQLAEGWFERFEDVPLQAMTLTIPTILRVPKLIVSIPGRRKARSVRALGWSRYRQRALPRSSVRTRTLPSTWMKSQRPNWMDWCSSPIGRERKTKCVGGLLNGLSKGDEIPANL